MTDNGVAPEVGLAVDVGATVSTLIGAFLDVSALPALSVLKYPTVLVPCGSVNEPVYDE